MLATRLTGCSCAERARAWPNWRIKPAQATVNRVRSARGVIAEGMYRDCTSQSRDAVPDSLIAPAALSSLEHDDPYRRAFAVRECDQRALDGELRGPYLRASMEDQVRRAIVTGADLDLFPADGTRKVVSSERLVRSFLCGNPGGEVKGRFGFREGVAGLFRGEEPRDHSVAAVI